jgi:hypothetical protein
MLNRSERVVSKILICAPDPLTDDLHDTVIWREGNERHVAATFEEAYVLAVAVHPDLIVVERDLPRALRLIEDLRRDAATRAVSIAVAARGDLLDLELQLLQAGANALIRLPAGQEWDERLSHLMRVPPRRATRVPVRLQFQGKTLVETIWGAVLNLSATGMLVEVTGPLGVGADLDFRFLLPDSGEPVRGTGQIVRDGNKGRFGVHFYGLEGNGAVRVAEFVAKGLARAQASPPAPGRR